MSASPSATPNGSVYRIDKFVVPEAAMPAFLERTERIKQLLSSQPGCKQNLVLRQVGGPGEFNVVTVVEWASADAMARARSAAQARYAEEGFDPEAFMKQLGVRGDIAVYAAT